MERRYAKRINMNCSGVLFLPEEEIPVRIKNISRGGILFCTDSYGFRIDDRFNFQFVDNEYNIVSGNASLVRVNRQDNIISIACTCPGFKPQGYIDMLEIKNAVEEVMAM